VREEVVVVVGLRNSELLSLGKSEAMLHSIQIYSVIHIELSMVSYV